MSEMTMARNQLDTMLEVLLQVTALADSDVRDLQVNELEEALRRPVVATRSVDPSVLPDRPSD
jgi:hypothetical protein